MATNYYKILGLPNGASQDDIKAAFRRLAKLYHPDITGNDTIKTLEFLTIKDAYKELTSNRQKLSVFEYDADVTYTEYDKKGNLFISFKCHNILFMNPVGPIAYSYYWTLAGHTEGRVMIKKKDLELINYKLALRFVAYNGSTVDFTTQLKKPLTPFKIFINHLKNFFK